MFKASLQRLHITDVCLLSVPFPVPVPQVFAFDRTVSRLLEMQSESYFAASTARYPVEAGGAPWLHRELLRLKDSATGKYVRVAMRYFFCV